MEYWTLSNINLYHILCPNKLRAYKKKEGAQYGKNDIIYTENKVDKNIYLVSNGKVKLVNYDNAGNEIVKQILTKGELFGESILLNESKRNEWAVACDSKTTICSMSLDNMKDLMRKNEKFSTTIYKLIGIRLKKMERRLELLIGKDVNSRVASYLLDLYSEKKHAKFVLKLSQKDIAVLLAMSRESVTKAFNKMKQEGIIDYTRKEIIINNLPELEKLSGK